MAEWQNKERHNCEAVWEAEGKSGQFSCPRGKTEAGLDCSHLNSDLFIDSPLMAAFPREGERAQFVCVTFAHDERNKPMSSCFVSSQSPRFTLCVEKLHLFISSSVLTAFRLNNICQGRLLWLFAASKLIIWICCWRKVTGLYSHHLRRVFTVIDMICSFVLFFFN